MDEKNKVLINDTIMQYIQALTLIAETPPEFDDLIRTLLRLRGKVVFTGVGKSSHIARKLAATFTSTGTPSIFVHATEASHGDMGILELGDLLFMLTASGSTTELNDFAMYARKKSIPTAILTKKPDAHLTRLSDYVVLLPDIDEACPNRLAPTTSTLCQLAVGDAIAIALSRLRDFRPEEFKTFHPGGKLGQLLACVADIMASGEELPLVGFNASVCETIIEMTRKGFGIAGIIGSDMKLRGVFTDGDLRRAIAAGSFSLDQEISAYSNPNFTSIPPTITVNDALNILSENALPNCFVLDKSGKPIGIVHLKLVNSGS